MRYTNAYHISRAGRSVYVLGTLLPTRNEDESVIPSALKSPPDRRNGNAARCWQLAGLILLTFDDVGIA